MLEHLDVTACAAVGHSLGELTALHWADALEAPDLVALARERGRIMAETGRSDGAMLHVRAAPGRVARLLDAEADTEVVVGAHNGPEQTVVSGSAAAVGRVRERARGRGLAATPLRVSHAFHSPLVAPAVPPLREVLDRIPFAVPARRVVSTVSGTDLARHTPLPELLCEQVTRPVLFREAVARVAPDTDLFLEVGPGGVLSRTAGHTAPGVPALAVDTDAPTLLPTLKALGAAYALGAPLSVRRLFEGRLVRPLRESRDFLANACEAAPDTVPRRTAPAGPVATAAAGPAREGDDTVLLLRRQVAARVELPLETVTEHTRPLDELHLSSITVGQIANEVARALGRPPLETAGGHATSSLAELAAAIDASEAVDESAPGSRAAGVGPWVRAFRISRRPVPDPVRPPRLTADAAGTARWSVHAPGGHALAEPLRAALAGAGPGEGVALIADAERPADALAAAQEAAARGVRLVVVQTEPAVTGLARTLHLEARVPVTVVESDLADKGLPSAVAAVASATSAYTEIRYAPGGCTVPEMVPLPPGRDMPEAGPPLGPDDVVLVTGGGKGITAECARDLADRYGPALLLLGRSDPANDPELAANLERMAAASVRHRYERADVTDPAQVRAAVARAAGLGPVTALLHGAGHNAPAPLGALTPKDMADAWAPKIDGLLAALAAVDPDRLRLLVAFGSVIGRTGLRGEAHYAAANDRMSALVEEYGRRHPQTRVLAVEWSVWSGAGMGERMGVVESLSREGVTPISVDEGLGVLRDLLADPSAGPVVTVCGRLGSPPTLPAPPPLPLGRFLEHPLVHHTGTELVTETVLSPETDPYLDDHRLDGDALFPAVIGMEAMAQVGTAVAGYTGVPGFEDMEFLRPVVVPASGTCTVRVAALVRDTDTVDVAVRSSGTGFAVDHFRAVLRRPGVLACDPEPRTPVADEAPVPVDPVSELYGGLLFQGKRFQRLTAYRRISARHTVAEVSGAVGGGPWFAPYLAQDLVLADPGVRDTAMHASQTGVPDAVLLPEGVDRLVPAPVGLEGPFLLTADEWSEEDGVHVYDVELSDTDGRVVERWKGLRLRAVRSHGGAGPWVAPLLGPHVERCAARVLGPGLAVAVEPDTGAGRREATAAALRRALGRPVPVRHRPDGRPEVDGAHVTVSHGAGVTLAVAADSAVGCDIEEVVPRGRADRAGLLGPDALAAAELLTAETGEDADTAATRLWTVLECLRKLGTATRSVVLDGVRPDRWAVFTAGGFTVATFVTELTGRADRAVPVAVAVGRAPRTPARKEPAL
ncbi:SDR family NAD(P)-dependent oxidoreductase [Nocardiopsis sp. ARC36]